MKTAVFILSIAVVVSFIWIIHQMNTIKRLASVSGTVADGTPCTTTSTPSAPGTITKGMCVALPANPNGQSFSDIITDIKNSAAKSIQIDF